MTLYEILNGVNYTETQGGNVEITDITIDSRQVCRGSLFVCIKGLTVDSHDLIGDVIASGAAAVVCEKMPKGIKSDVSIIKVKNSRKALGFLASNFYGNPSRKIEMFGVTGTNGKTSVTYFMEELLKASGRLAGVIGTTGARLGNSQIDVPYKTSTTPDTIELHRILGEMAKGGADCCVMEVTSHALALHKVSGIDFNIGIFTNLTQDHLDFHKTFDNYLKAKAELFKICMTGIFNADDSYCKRIIGEAACEIVTYGIENEAKYRAANVELLSGGVKFDVMIDGRSVHFDVPVPGRFTVYNTLAVIAAAVEMGISVTCVQAALNHIKGVRGRIESVANDKGFAVIVDYAHTPDGLDNIIRSVRDFTTGSVITVFGCGGNRDKTKRPIMGEIAGRLSDYCIITSDNPRNEAPETTIDEIEAGIKQTACAYEKVVDRKEAIRRAISLAKKDDSVIIAGKGHEDYQEFENKLRVHFDDVEVAKEILKA